MINSPIDVASDFACPAESVDEELCSAPAFVEFLYIGVKRSSRGESSEAAALWRPAWNSFQESKGVVSEVSINSVVSCLALCLFVLKYSSRFPVNTRS